MTIVTVSTIWLSKTNVLVDQILHNPSNLPVLDSFWPCDQEKLSDVFSHELEAE